MMFIRMKGIILGKPYVHTVTVCNDTVKVSTYFVHVKNEILELRFWHEMYEEDIRRMQPGNEIEFVSDDTYVWYNDLNRGPKRKIIVNNPGLLPLTVRNRREERLYDLMYLHYPEEA